jgi:hypothetical protein
MIQPLKPTATDVYSMSRRRFAALGCAWPIESVKFLSILQRLRLILAESKIS